MTDTDTSSASAGMILAACPGWCSAAHGAFVGEEDWVHESEPVSLADGVLALLRMSVDPSTGMQDGPYLFIGSREYTLDGATDLAACLTELAAAGRSSFASEQPESTRPVLHLKFPQHGRDMDSHGGGRQEQS